jgi:hypothetical protein
MQGRILYQAFGQFIIRSEIYYQGDPEGRPLKVSENMDEEEIEDDLFDNGQ